VLGGTAAAARSQEDRLATEMTGEPWPSGLETSQHALTAPMAAPEGSGKEKEKEVIRKLVW